MSDSPFDPTGSAYFHLEDFEDGALNTPGVSASAVWRVAAPSGFTDSVDADDGTINNSGTAGRSFYSGGTQPSLSITFSATALGGNLPTFVGIVWTDVGIVQSGTSGFGDVTFSAFGPMGISLGSNIGTNLGNGSAFGSGSLATAEDRFFGVINLDGISSITISMNNSVDWEVDHLQYGSASVTQPVPEPATMLLFVFGTGVVVFGRYVRKKIKRN